MSVKVVSSGPVPVVVRAEEPEETAGAGPVRPKRIRPTAGSVKGQGVERERDSLREDEAIPVRGSSVDLEA